MNKIKFLICFSFFFSLSLLTGCMSDKPLLEYHDVTRGNVTYSDDNETAIVTITDLSKDDIANLIDEMYDKGYVYIGEVEKAVTAAGRENHYIIFRLQITE